jgi:TcpE family
VELPTYTNIWKIEKRLYKLYDFRLPMPLPVSQVAAFLAIAIPYTFMLTLVGMPFSHTWFWLYVLPPAVLAWLVTRPVLEGKRLPELVLSQVRYLAEPRTWCRLAPLAERDEIIVVARLWRREVPGPALAADPDTGSGTAGSRAADSRTAHAGTAHAGTAHAGTAHAGTAQAGTAQAGAVWVRPAWPDQPAVGSRTRAPSRAVRLTDPPADAAAVDDQAARSASARPPTAPGPVSVHAQPLVGRPLRVMERALRVPADARVSGWHDRVVVVPGGHRPGKPDPLQRDQARARAPLAGPARIVILGTTGGAGQTITTLLAGQLLATLRGEAVAVLDLGSGPGALTGQARVVPRLLPSRSVARQPAEADGPAADARAAAGDQPAGSDEPAASRERGLQVVTAESGAERDDAGELIEAVVARYPLTLADPAPVHVPRALTSADQLVLVAPAGANAVGSLAMTLEWLEAHGHDRLARTAVIVLNGVSEQTAEHAERAAAVAAGRCRAVVRVPWDPALGSGGPLGAASVRAYTALAGVLVSGLADSARAGPAPVGSLPG